VSPTQQQGGLSESDIAGYQALNRFEQQMASAYPTDWPKISKHVEQALVSAASANPAQFVTIARNATKQALTSLRAQTTAPRSTIPQGGNPSGGAGGGQERELSPRAQAVAELTGKAPLQM